jgi:cytochrome oxidase Cu insertion factor (SCO1/SenC/PrrC family)
MPFNRETTVNPPKRLIGLLACLLILGAGAGLVGAWTLGFSAFTSYSYALIKAGPLPRAAPDISFVDQFGNERRLASLGGRYVLLHVFYGSCLTICPIVIEEVRQLYLELPAAQRNKLIILSLSVDSVRDTTERLLDFWREEGALEGWIMAQPADDSTARVAQEFGIWIYAKRDGTINHSADLFLIDPGGRIVRVFSPQSNNDRIRRDLEKYL